MSSENFGEAVAVDVLDATLLIGVPVASRFLPNWSVYPPNGVRVFARMSVAPGAGSAGDGALGELKGCCEAA